MDDDFGRMMDALFGELDRERKRADAATALARKIFADGERWRELADELTRQREAWRASATAANALIDGLCPRPIEPPPSPLN